MSEEAIGIYDFSYAPYALGDALTWQVNLMCEAYEKKSNHITSVLIADPDVPSNRFQKHINSTNYKFYLDNLLKAFLCTQSLREIKIFNDRYSFNEFISKNISNVRWPTFKNHLKKNLDYSSHKKINLFYKKYGFVPELQIPIGYDKWVKIFFETNLKNKYSVCVNIRQARLKKDPQTLYRDSPADVWFEFMQVIHKINKNIVFVLVGGYEENEHRFSFLPNVIVARENGLNLAHELAILKMSNLFMGTSSGFSAMATFAGNPYIITNYDPKAACETEIEIGSKQYPFAKKHQFLNWGREKKEVLINLFSEIYHAQ